MFITRKQILYPVSVPVDSEHKYQQAHTPGHVPDMYGPFAYGNAAVTNILL
jgi:hypothetical protein